MKQPFGRGGANHSTSEAIAPSQFSTEPAIPSSFTSVAVSSSDTATPSSCSVVPSSSLEDADPSSSEWLLHPQLSLRLLGSQSRLPPV